MENQPVDGGPAFPSVNVTSNRGFDRDDPSANFVEVSSETIGGMTLRDWFAGQALTGEVGCEMACALCRIGELIENPDDERPEDRGDRYARIARRCYGIADAMLKAGGYVK